MKRLVIAVVVLCALLATFLAVNGQMVLTGRLADRPLPLISGGPAVAAAAGIWSDTDAACGAAPRADPDDCFAIVWLLAQGADVIGISTSFGNAAGDVVAATVTGLAAALAQPSPQVYTGYVAPADAGAGAGAGTDAAPAPPGVIALQAALAEGPLTILALGPFDKHRRCPARAARSAGQCHAACRGNGAPARASLSPRRGKGQRRSMGPWPDLSRSERGGGYKGGDRGSGLGPSPDADPL